MNDAVNLRVCLEDLLERSLVGNIDLVEDWPPAAQQLNAVQADLGGVVQAVDNNHIVAVLEESEGCEGPNVASATAVVISTTIFIPAFETPRCGVCLV